MPVEPDRVLHRPRDQRVVGVFELEQRGGADLGLAMLRLALEQRRDRDRGVQRADELIRGSEIRTKRSEPIGGAQIAQQLEKKGEVEPEEQARRELVRVLYREPADGIARARPPSG